MHPLTKKSGKQGSVLQREYELHCEHCSGNNSVVKSLSPQAPCMAHLDLMVGVLSLLLYLQYFLSEWTPPILLFAPAIYNPALAICYFPLPLLPLCSFYLSNLLSPLSFYFLFRLSLHTPFPCTSFLYCSYRFLNFFTLHLYSPSLDPLRDQQVSPCFFAFALQLSPVVLLRVKGIKDQGTVPIWNCETINILAARDSLNSYYNKLHHRQNFTDKRFPCFFCSCDLCHFQIKVIHKLNS